MFFDYNFAQNCPKISTKFFMGGRESKSAQKIIVQTKCVEICPRENFYE